jgi:hypothetical protein
VVEYLANFASLITFTENGDPMKVMMFQTAKELENYLNATPVALAKIAAVYFDGASGKHVLVYDAS